MEEKLLSKIIDDKKFPEKIEAYHFIRNKDLFLYIQKFFRDFGTVPDIDTILDYFPNFAYTKASDPIEFYEENVITAYNVGKLNGGILDSLSFLEDKNVDSAVSKLYDVLAQIEEKELTDISIDDFSIMEKYEHAEERVGGYYTGIDRYDALLGGVFKKELHIVAGRAKVGKTMFMLKVAHNMFIDGANIMFISKEMSAEKLVQRFDAIHNNIPLGNMRNGKLTFLDVEKIRASKEEFSKMKNKCIFLANENLDRNTTVWSIVQKINKYKPDIVFVDSFYLFNDGGKNSDTWVRVGNVANDLADIARRCNVCMFGSTQLNRQVSEKENNTSFKSVGYSDTIIQVSNSLLALYQNPILKNANVMNLSLIAARDGEIGEFNLEWNFSDGCSINTIDDDFDDEEIIDVD